MTSEETRHLSGNPDGSWMRKQHQRGRKSTVVYGHVHGHRGFTIVVLNSICGADPESFLVFSNYMCVRLWWSAYVGGWWQEHSVSNTAPPGASRDSELVGWRKRRTTSVSGTAPLGSSWERVGRGGKREASALLATGPLGSLAMFHWGRAESGSRRRMGIRRWRSTSDVQAAGRVDAVMSGKAHTTPMLWADFPCRGCTCYRQPIYMYTLFSECSFLESPENPVAKSEAFNHYIVIAEYPIFDNRDHRGVVKCFGPRLSGILQSNAGLIPTKPVRFPLVLS